MRMPTWLERWSWSRPNNLGLLLLAVWLIAQSILQLFQLSFPHSNIVLPLIALVAGIAIAIDVRKTTLFLCVALILALALIVFLLRGI